MTEIAKKRPQYRNLNLFTDIRTYRLPLAGMVSILHRVSGMLLFILLPFIIWLFDKSVSSEISFGSFTSAFTAGLGFLPGWFIKLVALALIWAYLHHLAAGVRHLVLDVTHKTTKDFGRHSAVATLVFSIVLTLILGAKLFGLY
ncbi:MAG: succinate dehydrogenase, cytochrome b556 subunit [Comamonadaceae bacterium]|nr:succinate dehydrogenase, cytochrome b556 subunit [Pseudomonadota bacterium]MBS0608776.1 succinate dehydrogenase, cytochrome b556 subunit [Pseudomonadota bacterium]MDE2414119.1 succinate dehydrogenase, cytochrome b556 subunit [Comamonadaceae bacterium]